MQVGLKRMPAPRSSGRNLVGNLTPIFQVPQGLGILVPSFPYVSAADLEEPLNTRFLLPSAAQNFCYSVRGHIDTPSCSPAGYSLAARVIFDKPQI